MNKLLLIILIFFIYTPIYAQQGKGTVTGKITDAHGLPIPYITIMAHGTTTGTVTDEKGNFLLKLPEGGYTLVAKSMGYQPVQKSVSITADLTIEIDFEITEDNHLLQEVAVSGVKVKSAAATRTLLQLVDIPQSIVVIGQKSIKQQAAFDLTTITRNISGLNFSGSYAGAGSSQMFNARGFDLNDAQNYRLNGVMIWNLGNNYSDNIEQVEFLKGPASILFGDVAPGGVMNFNTKKPQAAFMADINLKTGSWGLVRPAVDITGSLTDDHTLRFRLNTSFERSDSFRDHVSSQRELFAPTIAWDITPKLSLTAEAVFKHSRATDDAGLVSPDGTVEGLKKLRPSLYLGEPSRNYTFKDQSYFTTITYELSNTWRIKATGFYGVTTNRPFGVWFGEPDANGDYERTQYGYYSKTKNSSASADAYGSFYTGSVKHNVLLGVEYQFASARFTNTDTLAFFDYNNINNPVYGQTPSPEPPTSPYLPYVTRLSRIGFYLQDQVMFFNERLHLLLGARMGRTLQGNHYYKDKLAGTYLENYQDDIISKWVFTPRLGLVYKPQTWASVYFSYSKGYEVNSAPVLARNYNEYKSPPPTHSTQVEFGSKVNLFGDRLGLSLTFFEINKHDPYGYVYLDPENPVYDDYNVYYQGHHRSRGIELDVNGKISKTIWLTAGVAYTRTRVMDDPGYPTGNVLPGAPKFTGNFWLNYEPEKLLKGFTFGTGLFYKGKFFSSIANDPHLEIPAGYTLDVAAGYKYKQMGIQLNVMNITNRVNYLNPWQFNLFDVRPLRQFVVTLSYRIGKAK
ncbi:hypothetical protein DJ568_06665 [Mucilaginibacter hurinus]|uniref:TonB-dependent siderophore receptor n=1 Tax=Mucilaginibacter hurinus TaxID=2201324 RepID=A0A367GQ45_9SPHI|nr:TonB-dependent receptor [Mucilaginibacter hurinus]RCH55569.1 hypothetical protein DJ568_06665 [Mucilaginibacter hurinus]